MNPKLAAATVQFIAVTSALAQKRAEEALAFKKREKEANEKIAAVLDHLVSTGCVMNHQREEAKRQLQKHASALDLLVNAATKIQKYKSAAESLTQKQASDLGSPDSVAKPKALSSLESPFVGRRSGNEKKASDLALLAILEPAT